MKAIFILIAFGLCHYIVSAQFDKNNIKYKTIDSCSDTIYFFDLNDSLCFNNKTYFRINSESLNNNLNHNWFDFLTFENDSVYILNALFNDSTKQYKPVKNSVFIVKDQNSEIDYISTSILGNRSILKNKNDKIYTYEIDTDISDSPFIQEFSFSFQKGILSFKYYTGEYLCTYTLLE